MVNKLMRCQYCGQLQDEPDGVKDCVHCGGELAYEDKPLPGKESSYIKAWLELDQVTAPAGLACDRYLLITTETPDVVPAQQAAPTETGRPALNVCAVLDTSGSMQGKKITQAKEAVMQAIRYLSDGDIFSLVAFSKEPYCVFEPVEVNQHTRKLVESALNETIAGGMTALCGGLDLGIQRMTSKLLESNLVLLLSDGLANVGETDLEQVGQHAYQARQQGITVSTLGIGMDYAEALMIEIANQGSGRFYHLQHATQIPAFLVGELGEAAAMAASEAVIELKLPLNATLAPFISAYKIIQGDGHAAVTIGLLPLETELEIPLRLILPPQAADTKHSIEGALMYQSPAGNQLSTQLNRVSLRIVSAETYDQQDGVVLPVAERVLTQIKSANVIDVSRAFAMSHTEGELQSGVELATLREYASKLGKERAEQEVKKLQQILYGIPSSQAAAKRSVSQAYAVARRTKDFEN